MEKIIINKTSEKTREAIKRSSSFSLPNNPSDRGMKPDQIRQAFWAPIVGLSASVLVELDRVVDEINAILGSNGTQSFNTEAKDLIGAVNELKAISDAIKESIESQIDEHNEDLNSHPAILEQLKNHYTDLRDCIVAIQEINAKIGSGEIDMSGSNLTENIIVLMDFVVQCLQRIGALETVLGKGSLQTPSKNLIPAINETYNTAFYAKQRADSNRVNLANLTAQVNGIARSFTVNTFLDFVDFMRGNTSVAIYEDRDGDGVAEVYNLFVYDLKTGDNILIVEKNVPDFWFEASSSPEVVEEYEYNEVVYSLKAVDPDGDVCGAMHILESDYNVLLGYATSASISAKEAKDAEQETKEALGEVTEKLEDGELGIIRRGNGANSVILNNPNGNTADGDNSIVGGTNCHANYQDSISFGRNCSANNNGAFGFGYECHSNAKYSWSSGHYCETSADAMAAHSFGQGLKANRIGQLLGGRYNKPNAKAAFIVGFGNSDTDRRNGLEVVIKNNVISLVLDGVAISSDELRTLIDNLSNIKKIAKLEEKVAALEKRIGVTLITFTICGSEYIAEDGMTLGEWCDSEYNTDGWVCSGDYGDGSNYITMYNDENGEYMGFAGPTSIIRAGYGFMTD